MKKTDKTKVLFLTIIMMSFVFMLVFKKTKNDFVESKVTISVKYLTQERNFKVNSTYAIVFYGRKAQTSILLQYLEKSVKANGGILDKIVFCVRTKNPTDLAYLETILNQNKSYFESVKFAAEQPYTDIYKIINDDDLVFKIDDDIVFIANGTFEKMVKEYMTKDLLFLSANVINHPLLSYAHARIRAILPFHEVKSYVWDIMENETSLVNTVVFNNSYDSFSKWWKDAKSAAVAHESFLHHMKTNNLEAYNFRYWDFHTEKFYRWSINFVLMRGKYVSNIGKLYPGQEDELIISELLPAAYKINCYALGNAVVSHFSYYTQYDYLIKTNILERYRKLAKDYLKE